MTPNPTSVGDPRLDRLILRLPQRLQLIVQWLRRPSSRWYRRFFAVLLICGGFFFFLPVLGLWMLPLGLMLLAEDAPFLRRMMDRVWDRLERRHSKWLP